jgi:hypothetical protein
MIFRYLRVYDFRDLRADKPKRELLKALSWQGLPAALMPIRISELSLDRPVIQYPGIHRFERHNAIYQAIGNRPSSQIIIPPDYRSLEVMSDNMNDSQHKWLKEVPREFLLEIRVNNKN